MKTSLYVVFSCFFDSCLHAWCGRVEPLTHSEGFSCVFARRHNRGDLVAADCLRLGNDALPCLLREADLSFA